MKIIKTNKGIVLSEVLCYISVFSMLMLILFSYIFIVNNFKKDKEISLINKSLELQELLFDIEDSIFVARENLRVVENEKEINLYGEDSNLLYLSIRDNIYYSDVLQRNLDLSDLNFEYTLENKFIFITNKDRKFNYVLGLEYKK